MLWVAAACLSIAVNGSRGLPQYFLQAAPALALAFGVAAAWAWPRLRPVARGLAVVAVAVAVQRVVNVDKIVDYLQWDASAWTGSRSREDYLARFGGRDTGDKYSALAVRELGQLIAERVPANETVLVLGFSPGALLQSERRSATRFFWSRPLIVGFGEGWPGYGVAGLLAELEAAQAGARRPAAARLGSRHDRLVHLVLAPAAPGRAGSAATTSRPASWATSCCGAARRSEFLAHVGE